MSNRRKYVKRLHNAVSAVQLDFVSEGFVFTYRKWGAQQAARPGDWLVDNDGDVYTVNRDSFARTYRRVGPGRYLKTTPVWAEQSAQDGEVRTLEGVTHYRAGDFLVFNEEDGADAYAMSAEKFEAEYERAD